MTEHPFLTVMLQNMCICINNKGIGVNKKEHVQERWGCSLIPTDIVAVAGASLGEL